MSRSRLADFMQSYRFWLFDAVPSLSPPFFVLGAPFFGFSTISSPEYTADVDDIKQINSMFKAHAYSGGAASPLTLTRGVRGFDDSMWRWMHRAIKGTDVVSRHLVLLHFTGINVKLGSLGVGGVDLPVDIGVDLPSEIGGFVPGKAWVLFDCIPTRYKGASDFDATDGSVSLSELDIQPGAFTEFSLLDPVF